MSRYKNHYYSPGPHGGLGFFDLSPSRYSINEMRYSAPEFADRHSAHFSKTHLSLFEDFPFSILESSKFVSDSRLPDANTPPTPLALMTTDEPNESLAIAGVPLIKASETTAPQPS